MLGFRYPFTNGSSRVSDKGLGDPNRPSNIFIIRTNKFGINMPIVNKEHKKDWLVRQSHWGWHHPFWQHHPHLPLPLSLEASPLPSQMLLLLWEGELSLSSSCSS